MSWGTIATWRMANEGVEKASTILEENGTAGDAVEKLINTVEAYHTVFSLSTAAVKCKKSVSFLKFCHIGTKPQGKMAVLAGPVLSLPNRNGAVKNPPQLLVLSFSFPF